MIISPKEAPPEHRSRSAAGTPYPLRARAPKGRSNAAPKGRIFSAPTARAGRPQGAHPATAGSRIGAGSARAREVLGLRIRATGRAKGAHTAKNMSI